jgi:hypothetical protein
MDYRRRELETVTTTIFWARSARDAFCVGCHNKSIFLSLELSAEMSGTDAALLLSAAANGFLHLQGSESGEQKICLRSLFKTQKRKKKNE